VSYLVFDWFVENVVGYCVADYLGGQLVCGEVSFEYLSVYE
jgi:hypothetical protein